MAAKIRETRSNYHLTGKAQWYNNSMVLTSDDIWDIDLDARKIGGSRDIESSIIESNIEAANQARLITRAISRMTSNLNKALTVSLRYLQN